jgi:adenylate cyclase
LLPVRRRLVAVLAADVAGYCRLMEAEEEITHAALMRLRAEVLDPGIAAHRGRLVKNTGDGFLAMFDNAHNAARCALCLQGTVASRSGARPAEQRISFRMAVNMADAIIEHDDIYGSGVNIAARLQEHAEPGGVAVSDAVAEQLGRDLSDGAIDLGDLRRRNLARRVRALALRPSPTAGADRAGG